MNYLIMQAADKSKLIFNINIEILATLMLKWKHLITIDKQLLEKMLMVSDSKEGSHLYKMTGIQVLALAVSFNVSVLTADELKAKREAGSKVAGEFKIDSENDRLFKSLLSLQDLRKKQLIFASSEALGKILGHQPELLIKALDFIRLNEQKESRHDIYVNVIERITRYFPEMLV